jgi:heme O synthase-like polyprenyltransferase
MSIASHNESALPIPIGDYAAGPGEYFALLKPRVMSLVIWTALAISTLLWRAPGNGRFPPD